MIRKIFYLTILISLCCSLYAQNNYVEWKNTVKKVGVNLYEIHLKAKIYSSWHMYSQIQPANAIPLPTVVALSKNPMIVFEGKTREVGRMEIHKDAVLGSTEHRYTGSLEFVQSLKLKAKVKTNVAGSVTYQLCTDERCLPTNTMSFNLKIE